MSISGLSNVTFEARGFHKVCKGEPAVYDGQNLKIYLDQLSREQLRERSVSLRVLKKVKSPEEDEKWVSRSFNFHNHLSYEQNEAIDKRLYPVYEKQMRKAPNPHGVSIGMRQPGVSIRREGEDLGVVTFEERGFTHLHPTETRASYVRRENRKNRGVFTVQLDRLSRGSLYKETIYVRIRVPNSDGSKERKTRWEMRAVSFGRYLTPQQRQRLYFIMGQSRMQQCAERSHKVLQPELAKDLINLTVGYLR